MPLRGTSRPISIIASLKRSRSSAVAIASALAPIISGVPGTTDQAPLEQGHRRVQAGLAAERRQHGVGALALDDPGDDVGRDRLDVGPVGEVRVGHDRGRVRVDEDDAVALLAQHPAGLGAGVVELAGLADHDRTGPDDEDRVQIVAPRHLRHLPCVPRPRRPARRRPPLALRPATSAITLTPFIAFPGHAGRAPPASAGAPAGYLGVTLTPFIAFPGHAGRLRRPPLAIRITRPPVPVRGAQRVRRPGAASPPGPAPSPRRGGGPCARRSGRTGSCCRGAPARPRGGAGR